jgi:hypothetical protein
MTWWSPLRIPGVTGFTPTENDRTTLNFTDLLVNNTNTVQTVTYQFIPKILDPRTGAGLLRGGHRYNHHHLDQPPAKD